MNLKTSAIALFFFLSAAIAFAQRTTRTITFTGRDNGIFTKADSVRVRNLDRLCDTTVIWTDSTFSFRLAPCWGIGMDELKNRKDELLLMQNAPNPVVTDTKICLYLPESGPAGVMVTLATGRQVAAYHRELDRGYHSFLFTPGVAGTFIFSVFSNSGRKSIKIVSAGTTIQQGCRLTYLGMESGASFQKSAKIQNPFAWDTCNNLEFTGFHDSLSATIHTVCPLTDTTFSFDFTHSAHSCLETSVYYGRQTYHTVQIGLQCWFKENLNIGVRLDTTQIPSNNGKIEKHCYDDFEYNCDIYGALYSWKEMMQYSETEGARGICPSGWHIPAKPEMIAMIDVLGPDSVAGGKLKEANNEHWLSPNASADNSSGFTALPGGIRDNGFSDQLHRYTSFWSSYAYDQNNGWSIALAYNSAGVGKGFALKRTAISVRCLHD